MIKEFIRRIIKGREFTAENCRIKQNSEINRRALLEIEDIKSFIRVKTSDSVREKAAMFSLPENSIEIYPKIKEYFEARGFTVFTTSFAELGDIKFIVISWL